MTIQNIDWILLFREDAAGRVLNLGELQAKYGLDPDGTNFYYGVSRSNAENFSQTGRR